MAAAASSFRAPGAGEGAAIAVCCSSRLRCSKRRRTHTVDWRMQVIPGNISLDTTAPALQEHAARSSCRHAWREHTMY